MTTIQAGNAASSRARMPTSADAKTPISPAARKFAEYLARRMLPTIESARKQQDRTPIEQ
jgi:hypothetical protein